MIDFSDSANSLIEQWPYRQIAFWRRFTRHRLALVGLGLIAIMLLCSVFAPITAPYDPVLPHYADRLQPPSSKYLLGTDELGRDLLSRLLYGGRISFFIGFVSQIVASTLGTFFGMIAGWYGGWPDDLIMRLAEIVFAVPALMFLIVWVTLFQPTPFNIFLGLGLVSWTGTARIIRAQVLTVKEQEYIAAAKALGASTVHILRYHILPNSLTPIIVLFALGVGGAILSKSTLSFLGLGITIPTPSWGIMVETSTNYMTTAWWYTLFPGLTITMAVLSFNFVGDGLRAALNPTAFR